MQNISVLPYDMPLVTRRNFLTFFAIGIGSASIASTFIQKTSFLKNDTSVSSVFHLPHNNSRMHVAQRSLLHCKPAYYVTAAEEIDFISKSRYYFTWHLL